MQEYNEYIQELYKVIDKIERKKQRGPSGQDGEQQSQVQSTPYRQKNEQIESSFEED